MQQSNTVSKVQKPTLITRDEAVEILRSVGYRSPKVSLGQLLQSGAVSVVRQKATELVDRDSLWTYVKERSRIARWYQCNAIMKEEDTVSRKDAVFFLNSYGYKRGAATLYLATQQGHIERSHDGRINTQQLRDYVASPSSVARLNRTSGVTAGANSVSIDLDEATKAFLLVLAGRQGLSIETFIVNCLKKEVVSSLETS